MKKTLLTLLILASLFAVTPAKAQTTDELYRQTLITLINLLIQRVEELQRQLAAMQAVQVDHVQSVPTGTPSAPQLPAPKLFLQSRTTRTVNPNKHEYITIWQNGKNQEVRTGGGYLQDSLDILINTDGRTDLACIASGNWSGQMESGDYWFRVENPQEGEYRLKCNDVDGRVSEDYVIVNLVQ